MKAPTIHMNGTAASELANQWILVYHKANDTIDALKQAEPNGRDYYVQGAGAIGEALEDQMSLLRRVQGVADEAERVLLDLMDQDDRIRNMIGRTR